MAESENVRFDDLFPDFDKNINQAIKSIERLNQSFDKLFASIAQEGKKLKDVFSNADFGSKEFNEASQKAEEYKETVKSVKKVQGELNNSFAALKQRQEEIRKEQKQLDKTTKDGAKRFDELQKELISTGVALNKLNQQTRASARVAKSATDSYDELSAELGQLRRELKTLPDAFDKSSGAINKNNKRAVELQQRISKIDGALKNFDKSIGENFRNVGNYEMAIQKAGVSLGKFGLALAGGFTAVSLLQRGFSAAIKSFQEFDLTTAKVAAISGANAEELARLENQAKQLGATTFFSASQVAELQLELSKLGLTADQIQDSTGAILDFAVATDSDLARAGKVVASTLNAFNLEASEAGRVADVAAKAFSSSALDIDKFETALGLVGATASSFGLTIEETSAVIGTLVDAGIDASTAATGFRKVLAISAKQGRDYREVLAEITDSTNGLKTASELFGLTAQSQGVVLAENISKIDELTEAFKGAEGAAKAAANIIGDTLSGDLKRLDSAFEAFSLSVFEGEGALGSFARSITQLATGFLEAITPSEKLSDTLREQNTELNVLVRSITNANIGERTRSDLIEELNQKYPEFLANIDREKDLNSELERELEKVNQQFLKRIELQLKQEEIQEINEELAEVTREQIGLTKELSDLENQAANGRVISRIRLENLRDRIEALTKEQDDLINQLVKLAEEETELSKAFQTQTSEIEKNTEATEKNADANKVIIGAINNQRALIDALNKERNEANEEDIAGITKRLELADEELKRLEALGKSQKELTDFRKQNIEELADFTQDEIELLKFKNEIIDEIIADEVASEEDKREAIEEIERASNSDLLARRLQRAKRELDILNDFGDQEITDKDKLNQEILDKTKEIEELETQILKNGLSDREKLREEDEERQKRRRSAVLDGVVEGLRERERLRQDEERNTANQIEDEEQRQKALDQIARKAARRELAIAALSAFTNEIQATGDINEATRKATDVLVAGTIAQAVVGFEEGGYTGDYGTKEVAGVVHGQEFVIDAPTTKMLGLNKQGATMKDFKSIINDKQLDLAGVYAQSSRQILEVTNNVTNFEFTETHARMMANHIKKAMPKIGELIKESDGNWSRQIKENNRKETNKYRINNSPIKNNRVL